MTFPVENMVILDCVDSTNNYAMAQIKNGEPQAGNPVLAMQQTGGKGRRNKNWKSNKSENILLSIPVKLHWFPISQQFQLSVAVALACFDLISQTLLANIFIKWPNDIFINDKKTAGILIENILRGKIWQWAIIGIGMNINQVNFEELNSTATSFRKETGESYEVLLLAKRLYVLVLKRIMDVKNDHFEKMLNEYNQHLYGKGKKVKLKKQGIILETKIIEVSSSGKLLTKDGINREFDFDEVEFKGIVES
ncbi:MAG: biotin--[acetyl-CoA-carboxylase] ligase [Ginsengibacter sp.]